MLLELEGDPEALRRLVEDFAGRLRIDDSELRQRVAALLAQVDLLLGEHVF